MPPPGNPYLDVPLNLGRKNIRLVTLEPDDASGSIKCSLQSHALDECPAYVALSYAWGAKQRYDNIQINGSSFPVGRNLWHFLHQMRMQRQHVSFWIDAISIDQANVLEQNHQVQMMREIYTQAYSVWVWLGEADHSTSSDVAMRYLSKRAVWSGRDVDLRRFWSARKAKAVLELCERGYWRRIWIVQEVLLAKHIQILCGGYCVEWAKLQQLLEDFQAISDRGRSLHVVGVPAVLESSAAIIIRAKAQWNGDPQPFTLLLEQYHRQYSTDVRDKVYALHGLASDSSMIPINYRIDPKQLLTKMICHACSPLAPKMGTKRSSTGLLDFAKLMQESLKILCDREELGRHVEVAWWNRIVFCNFSSSRETWYTWRLDLHELGKGFGQNIDDMIRYRDKSLHLQPSDSPEQEEVVVLATKKGLYHCSVGCRTDIGERLALLCHAQIYHDAFHDCFVDGCLHRFDRKDQLWEHIRQSHRNVLQSPSLSAKMFDFPYRRNRLERKLTAVCHSQHKTNPYTIVHWDWRWHSLRVKQPPNRGVHRHYASNDRVCTFCTYHWECRLNECSCKYITRQ